MLTLPFEFSMPDTLFEDELLSLTEDEKRSLLYAGLQVHSLDGGQVARAYENRTAHRRLSLHDTFALVLAEDTQDSILLTGDQTLKEIAVARDIESHGILWVLDLIAEHETAPKRLLINAINTFIDDPNVWLPNNELTTRLEQHQR